MTAWYENASVHWPWLVRKDINIIQFSTMRDDGGHNQYAAKLSFKLLGFQIGKEYLLVADHQSPSWGMDWSVYNVGEEPDFRCLTYKENVTVALEKWFDMVERTKEYQKKKRDRQLDRGTFVSKYTR